MGFGPLPGAPDSSVVITDGPWAHRTVRANGIALHVAELGSGPLVLLIHGFPQFWWTWQQQLVDLADAGYRAVAVDVRGYGASDKPPRGYDSPTLTADMAALVGSLGESDAVVVGNDLGGTLGWTMAARYPRVVRALVVLAAAHPLRMRAALRSAAQRRAAVHVLRTFQVPRRAENLLSRPESPWVAEHLARWSGPRWRESPGFEAAVDRYAEAMRIHPVSYCAAEHYRWLARSVVRADGRHYVTSLHQPICAPVLHLHGELDTCVLPASAQGSGRYVTGEYVWRVLPGVGHYPQNEAPGLVSGEIIRWAKPH